MTYFSLPDENIQSTNTSSISCRHSVYLIHDQTGLLLDPDTGHSGRLAYQLYAIPQLVAKTLGLAHPDTGTCKETIKTSVIDIGRILADSAGIHGGHLQPFSTHFDQFLTSHITRIQLDRGISRHFRHQVCAGRLSDTRWTRNQDGSVHAHTIFSWFLEATLIAGVPSISAQSADDSSIELTMLVTKSGYVQP